MRFKKISISLPANLADYVRQEAAQRSLLTQTPKNASAIIAGLIHQAYARRQRRAARKEAA